MDEIVERSFARFDEGRDTLRVLRVGNAFEEAVVGEQRGEAHLRTVDQRSEAFAVALAGFAKKHRLNRAARTQRFFDKAGSLDTNEAVFRGQTTAQSQAELLEPAVVAAGEKRRIVRWSRIASGFSGSGHSLEVSKFPRESANLKAVPPSESIKHIWPPEMILRAYQGYGSVAPIRAARAERCKVALRLRQRPKNCRLNCCASIPLTRKGKCCDTRRVFSRAEV